MTRVQRITPEGDVLVLADDVETPEPETIARLRAAVYAHPRTGIAGCRLATADGTLLHAGTYVVPDTGEVHAAGAGEIDLGQYGETRAVEGVSFVCAYIRREVLDELGSPSGNDADYCLSAAERGYGTVCCGDVTLRTSSLVLGNAMKSRPYTFALGWQTLMNLPIGYATSAREMMRTLDARGTRITYSYAYGAGTPWPFTEPEESGDPRLDSIRKRREPDRPPVVVTYAAGNVFRRNRGAYKIGFTMIEVDGFPAEWVRQANAMDEVWTPTEFNRRGLIESGVTRPVHVVPLGIDPDHFHPGITRIPNPSADFVFLGNFEWGARKAPDLLLRAFNETFRAKEPVILVCKTLNRDRSVDVASEIRALGLDPHGGRIHFLHNREIPHYQLATLYRSADCFVSTSRGEGWGLPTLEAMACGVPVIATDWGGHTAILNADDTYPLRVRAVVPADDYYAGHSWAEPDGEHLRHLLRHVYEHRDEAREKGLRGSARVRQALTWNETAKTIERQLERVHA
jgi:glycosyltransferase involved in cell wall biosynthesis